MRCFFKDLTRYFRGRLTNPIFSIRNASGVMRLPLPATSIFTIDKQTEKFVSVHNMFDIDKVYNAIRSQQN